MNVSKRYRFFRSVDNGWQLQDELRNITRFEFHNLVTDPPPTLDGQPFDLIICRNVFIYLTSEAKKSCIKHLLQGLAPDGFLVAGHNELYGFTEGLMGLTMFADGYAYQKKAGGSSKPLKPAWSKASKAVAQSSPITRPTHKRTAAIPKSNTVLSRPAPTKIKPHSNNNTRAVDPASDDKVVKARKLFDSAAYSDLVDFTNRLSAAQPGHYTLLHLRARALANLAKYEEARACAEEMSGLRPFDPLAHFLIAHIHEADDDFYLAQQSLQKVVYLDPQFVPAYLGLALLYARQGDQKRSDQMRETALGVLQNLPDGAVIDPYTGETADEVLKQMGLGIPDDEGHLVRRQ